MTSAEMQSLAEMYVQVSIYQLSACYNHELRNGQPTGCSQPVNAQYPSMRRGASKCFNFTEQFRDTNNATVSQPRRTTFQTNLLVMVEVHAIRTLGAFLTAVTTVLPKDEESFRLGSDS